MTPAKTDDTITLIRSEELIPAVAGEAPCLNNRTPLAPLRLIQLPPAAITSGGWIRTQLHLMRDGMTGHLEELSHHLSPENGWFQDGREGWEEQPYWLRGYYAVAILTRDEQSLRNARRWIEAVLASQTADGWFGSSYHQHRTGTGGRCMCDLWPHMVMLHVLRMHEEYTGDARVLDLMTRFFAYCRAIPDDKFIQRVRGPQWQEYREEFGDWKIGVQIKRAGEMLTHIYWLYNRTGESALLDLATRFFRSILPPVSELLDDHVVNFTQRYAYPAIYGQQRGVEQGVAESEFWYAQHMAIWGQQPRGAFGADERVREGKTDPRQAMETCAMIEFAAKFYEIGRITGNPLYADRVEDLLLNHYPAAQAPDLKSLHYLTASNMPQLDAGGGHDSWNEEVARERGELNPMLSYSPHRYRCCQHNVAMGWPYYAQNLWQASADGGLVAWLYGESQVEARVVGGGMVRLAQRTNYPFAGKIEFTVQQADGGKFPLYLRVPGWCRELCVSVNDAEPRVLHPEGRDFVCVRRNWQTGDRLALELTMPISHTTWPRSGAVTVDRGPLSYSVCIPEEWRQCGGTEAWPEWEVLPTGPWNYGLQLDSEGQPQVRVTREEHTLPTQPWTVENAPVELTVLARQISAWTLEEGGSPQELRRSPIRADAPLEEIKMVPLGCSRLRMSCLPVVEDSPEARPWGDFRDC